ncbi:uncharacterized protein LOC135343285 isoform X2 [Halichondria panicea]|uniref:uncharacterized protein LOC135343285 isoform X2 n=1 Tax=Halichondria panicea TaxID=6063 RepID=UPI00312BB585
MAACCGWPMIFIVLFSLSAITEHCNAQLCSQTVSPTKYIAFPTLYNGVVVLSPSICETVLSGTLFRCDYAHVLGDGAMVPSTPDLSNSMYLGQFVAWERGSATPYIDFDLTTATTGITTIELSFLNSPSSRISLPDIELSRVTYVLPSFATDTESSIASRVLNNQNLALTDNQVRTVFVRPVFTQASLNLRISFQFDTHDFDWLLLNEVRFCTDPQPSFRPVVMFLAPLSNVIQPSAEDLTRGSTELVCTVSSEGSYTWQWERDNVMIGNNGDYTITIGDGSRTTKLMISNLDFSDAAEYECTGTIVDLSNVLSTNSSIQDLRFPERVITAPNVRGYLQTREVTLTCELHGYQSSPSPPVWFDSGGSEINTTTKYTITSGDGENIIVLENGTAIPSVIVSLTIHCLSSADEGTYTCRGVRGESITQLVIINGTAPSTTPPPTTINGGNSYHFYR